MLEILSFTFFQNAINGAILVSIACGLVGSLIMINRLFSIAGGITHGAFGGIGIAFYFSLPILLSTSIFTLFLALIVAFLTQHFQNRSDSIIAVICTIFASHSFAKTLAKECDANIVQINHLSQDWENELLKSVEALASSLK